MIYLVSLLIFSSVIIILVFVLLFVEAKVTTQGSHTITINDSKDDALTVSGNPTLLSALSQNDIFLPSACGGSGSCAMCKCKVTDGGGAILPTELAHLSRKEKLEGVRLSCQLKVKQDMAIQVPESIFGIKKVNAVVVSNDNVSTFIKELVLEPEEPIEFEAGAYIQLDVPEYELTFKDFQIDSKYVSEWKKYNLFDLAAKGIKPGFRAYSMANPPHEKDIIKLNVRIATPPPGTESIPPGFGSSFIFGLNPGDKVQISGPYGDFMAKDTDKEMCFIGGGAGMAPLRSHILHQLEGIDSGRKITFWYGARSVKEMFYHEEFLDLEKRFDNFTYHVALSSPEKEDNWTGPTGFVHVHLIDSYLKDHEDPTEIEYYLCGPPPMIDAVIESLYDLGVEDDMIFFDKFS
ncbi:NADH:ubiquinone reductase (Na(+)-transporting) subunit F [Desulfotignum phosphitoxidans]|uniref:Na(+)-translocating NADH-quinone reductase subunit F n=1 Tax=Desulfotignum phosphitoxidans DSM 13687 TaxID=1286635 RepID=S0FZJ4_9BACT|nr:NADH:ubiquinone reductase (Na(+)-transporting) subunit F [Desulfotignum phosphitoxidans]EMS77382.1 Na(+)-translocating NADH-quinone reductase subunit F [Desulfotignum phosphitoxidans DSM 13687]